MVVSRTRALLLGCLLGSLLGLSNLYLSLKTGWVFGVSLAAILMSTSLSGLLHRHLGLRLPGLEDDVAMQTAASAAGFSTGNLLASAFCVRLAVTGVHPPFLVTVLAILLPAWLGAWSIYGWRHLYLQDPRLSFPTGAATAEVLRALHRAPEGARSQTRALSAGTGVSALVAGLRDGLGALPGQLSPGTLRKWIGSPEGADPSSGTGFALELSPLLLGVGALMGSRIAASMLLGVGLNCLPGMLEGRGSRLTFLPTAETWEQGKVWVAAALLVTATVLEVLPSVVGGLRSMLPTGTSRFEGPQDAAITGGTYYLGLAALMLLVTITFVRELDGGLGPIAFAAILAVPLAFVATRAIGETDTIPSDTMGRLAQVANPGSLSTTLLTGHLAAGASLAAGDLASSLKTAQLVSASMPAQLLAQLVGSVAGALTSTWAFYTLIPNIAILESGRFPVPGAKTWQAITTALSEGAPILSGGLAGLIPVATGGAALLVVGHRCLPGARAFLPSPVGIGLAFLLPPSSSVTIFTGAALAWWWTGRVTNESKRTTGAGEAQAIASGEQQVTSVASGLIAGESFVGIGLALAKALGDAQGE